MKKLTSILLTIILLVWSFLLPNQVWAASPSHDFDDCDNDTQTILVDCASGGSNWATSWVENNAGDYISETTNCQSSNCVENNFGGDTEYARTFTETSTATGSFYVRKPDGTVNTFQLAICASGDTRCSSLGGGGTDYKFAFNFGTSEAVTFFYSGGNESLGTADTTHKLVEFEWGAAGTCAAGEVRARFNAGSWSTCKTMITTQTANPGGINLAADDTSCCSSTDKIQFDTFTVTESAGVTATTPTKPLWMKLEW